MNDRTVEAVERYIVYINNKKGNIYLSGNYNDTG